MDKSTHEIRIASKKTVIERCQSRPNGQTIDDWCAENDIKVNQYYYWQRRIRKEVYNAVSSTVFCKHVLHKRG